MFYLFAFVLVILPFLLIILLIIFSKSSDEIAYSKYRPQGLLCTSSGCIRCNRNKQEYKQGIDSFKKYYKNDRSCLRLKPNLDYNKDHDGIFLKLDFLNSTPIWPSDLFTPEMQRDVDLLNTSRNIISLECSIAIKCAYLWRKNEENATNCWYTFSLINQGAWQEEQCRVCPQIVKLLHRMESLLVDCLFGNVFISMLPKNSEIAEHRGLTNIRLRVHFGVEIPEDKNSCYMIKFTWDYGNSVIFDDSFTHSVSSKNCAEDRMVLVLDIWHPDLTHDEKNCLTKIFPAIYV